MPGRRHYLTQGWDAIADWTFHLDAVPKQMSGWITNRTTGNQPGTRIQHRAPNAYRYPEDPSLTGETILRAIKEMA